MPTNAGRPRRKEPEPARLGPVPREGPAVERPGANDHSYVVPLVHVSLPESAVTASFWGALGAAAVLGAVDPPLAVLIGAGVVIARHRHS